MTNTPICKKSINKILQQNCKNVNFDWMKYNSIVLSNDIIK